MGHRGRLPNRKEIGGWDEGKHLSFLAFCKEFIETKPGGGTQWRITPERRETAQNQVATNGHYQEFLERVHLLEDDTSDKKFYYRLMTTVRLVLGYLRINPDSITPAMRNLLAENERLSWCLDKQVQPSDLPLAANNSLTPEGDLAAAQQNSARILHMLTTSITEKEIAKMSTKDRLLAISRLQQVFGSRKTRRTISVLSTLNTETMGVKELERVMLAYAEEQQEDF